MTRLKLTRDYTSAVGELIELVKTDGTFLSMFLDSRFEAVERLHEEMERVDRQSRRDQSPKPAGKKKTQTTPAMKRVQTMYRKDVSQFQHMTTRKRVPAAVSRQIPHWSQNNTPDSELATEPPP